MREGIAYIKRHDFLKTFFFFNAIFLIFMGPMAFLTPLQIARSFGDEVWRLSALEIGFSLGMVLDGIVIPLFNTPSTVLLQERIEGPFLGRIFGVNTMIASSLMPLSMLVYGPLADIIPIETLLLVTGALLVVQSAFMMANKALRQAGEPVAPAVK